MGEAEALHTRGMVSFPGYGSRRLWRAEAAAVAAGLDALAVGLGRVWVACGGSNPAKATLERTVAEAGVTWTQAWGRVVAGVHHG